MTHARPRVRGAERYTGLLLQARLADVEDDLLQEEAAASQGEQGPGPGSDAHYTPRGPRISGAPSAERIPYLGRLLK